MYRGLFLFIFLNLNANALVSIYKVSCSKSPLPEQIDQIYILGEQKNCDTIDQYISVIEDINLFNPVKIPKLSFTITSYGDDANNKAEHITIPTQIFIEQKGSDYILKQDIANNYLAHEYGHSLFNQQIIKAFSPLSDSLNMIQNINQLIYQKYDAEILEDLELLDTITHELEGTQFNTYTNNNFLKPILYILPMAELYSDLVAVLYADDLQAFSKTFIGDNPSSYHYKEASYRDFSQEHDPLVHNNDQRHQYYAPVRSYLGELINFPLPMESKKELLKKVAEIMKEKILFDWNRSPKNIVDNNRDLIKRLRNKI